MAKRIYMRSNRLRGYSNQILQQLESEGNRLIQQMQDKLTRQLLQQLQKAGLSESGAGSEEFSLSGFTSLFPTALKFLSLARPKTSVRETGRSHDARQQFRLSQSQAAAETNAALLRAQKNG